jgi:hypothetical protein
MVEQILMVALRKQFDALWLIGGAVDPQTHFHRNHTILLAVQDENRAVTERMLRSLLYLSVISQPSGSQE